MPRNIEAKKKKGIDKKKFLERQKAKKVVRKPKKPKKKVPLSKAEKRALVRDTRLSIRYAANNLRQIEITYHKTTTKEVNTYRVAPYSYRYKRLKIGVRKMLFAFDMDAGHIKGFALNNISKVSITNRPFVPKWPVEIE
jgi:predicted DNA-binding transcriptional regulator YafY